LCQKDLDNHIPPTFGAIGVQIIRLHDLRAFCQSYCLGSSLPVQYNADVVAVALSSMC
jgi:hypothetical protein